MTVFTRIKDSEIKSWSQWSEHTLVHYIAALCHDQLLTVGCLFKNLEYLLIS